MEEVCGRGVDPVGVVVQDRDEEMDNLREEEEEEYNNSSWSSSTSSPSSNFGVSSSLLSSSSNNTGMFGRLSDEVILMILTYLGSRDLFSLMQTCDRLNTLCAEPKLWTVIEDPPDTREALSLTLNQLMTHRTTKLVLKADTSPFNRGYRTSLSPSEVGKLLCPNRTGNLREMQLINHVIDSRYFRLQELTQNLKVLSLRGCVVSSLSLPQSSPFLKDIANSLTNLEDLDLSYCDFISAHSLMSLSKLPSLKKLYLKGCREIGDCLAYVALSTRFGFKTLQVLDVTDTKVASTEVGCISDIVTLEEFYFGQYDAFVDRRDNYVDDMCLTRLRSLRNLKIVDFSGHVQVTDRTLDVLQTLSHLEKVDAHFTSLTDEGIQAFHQRNNPSCTIYKDPNPVEVPVPPRRPTPPLERQHNHISVHYDPPALIISFPGVRGRAGDEVNIRMDNGNREHQNGNVSGSEDEGESGDDEDEDEGLELEEEAM